MDRSTQQLLTPRQAYLVMFEFLRQYYERGQSDEIGNLLGNLSLLSDGSSADPPQWTDWEIAVDRVLETESTVEGYREADFRLNKK